MMTKKDQIDFVILGDGITADIFTKVVSLSGKSFYRISGQRSSIDEQNARSLALSPSTMKMLKFLDINLDYERLDKMEVYEGKIGGAPEKGKVIFDKKNNNNESLAYIVKYNDIKETIRLKASEKELTIFDKSISSLDLTNNSVFIKTDEGQELIAKNIVFTEKLSPLLLNILKSEYKEKDYKQKSIVATLDHELPHKNTAYQFFLSGGPLALLPLRRSNDNNRSSLIWSADNYIVDDILNTGDLRDTLNNMLSSITGQINISEGPLSVSLVKRLLKGRINDKFILIGESMRQMHPMAGQGWNQAIRDISYFADAIAESESLGIGLESTPSFITFKRLRKVEGDGMVNFIDLVNSSFSSDSSISKGIRRNIMKLINSFSPINSLFIKEAEGGLVRKPNLLNGEAPGSKNI